MLRTVAGLFVPEHGLRRGFTLIELLVVIGIIGILAGIVMPSIAAAQARAKTLSCANNLRQILQAMVLHASVPSNQGQFPNLNDAPMDALNSIYGTHLNDPRVFSCPGKPTQLRGLQKNVDEKFAPNLSFGNVTPGTNYGYDLRHDNTHGMAGIVGDAGGASAASGRAGNATNHGSSGTNGKGQNIAFGDGSVQWLESADRELFEGIDHLYRDDTSSQIDLSQDTFLSPVQGGSD